MSASGAKRVERPLVEVESLVVEFRVSARDWAGHRQALRAVDGVTLDIERGELLALIGESGCGKTTFGRTLMLLYKPAAGSVVFDGLDIAGLSREERAAWRRRVQMIFQDPYASLNPRMRIEDVISEPLRANRRGTRAERRQRVRELLGLVGLPAAAAGRYPNAFSGGQRQRIGIARALALRPEFIIADEPVSALDVSVQAQIVNLIRDLQEELGLTVLVISHDLAVVRHVSSRIAVMYLGRLVEVGPTEAVFADPLHPYTQSLLSAVPVPDPHIERSRRRIVLSPELPSLINPPSGCRFHTRCPVAISMCATVEPQLRPTAEGRMVACHLVHPPGSTDATEDASMPHESFGLRPPGARPVTELRPSEVP